MLARATFRAASAPTLVARRGFQSTRAQMSSPYHYPEGPRSNLPFDPLKKGFAFKYWGFMGELSRPAMIGPQLTAAGTGFALPFLLAGKAPAMTPNTPKYLLTLFAPQSGRRRRTSRRRDRTRLGHGRGRKSLRAYGTCRISGGPNNDILDITTSISSSVPSLFHHVCYGRCAIDVHTQSFSFLKMQMGLSVLGAIRGFWQQGMCHQKSR